MKLTNAIYDMLCKLAGSRKAFFNLSTTFFSWVFITLLILDLVPESNKWLIFYIYLVDQISTMSYIGILAYNPISLEASVKK